MNSSLLDVEDLSVDFVTKKGFGGRVREKVRAVDGVSFEVPERQTLGLVGESGSGKSTTGRALLRLLDAAGGTVSYGGREILSLSDSEFRPMRREMQMVFQDPYSSLNPSMTVADSIAEPLGAHEPSLTRAERRERAAQAMRRVNMSVDQMDRYPHEFSGGQRQRIAIARATILEPRFIVCDEPVSALDASTKGRVVNLLQDLQDDMSLTYLFIAHDLEIVRRVSTQIAVMYLGRIVEYGPSDRVYESPAHPYTRALLAATPIPNPRRQRARERIRLRGEIPSPLSPPSGCRFHTRCPLAMDICRSVAPTRVPIEGGGAAECHLYTEERPRQRTQVANAEAPSV